MINLLLDEKVWEKEVVDGSCLFRPISMTETHHKSLQQLKDLGLPYVITKETDGKIVSAEASVGVIRAVPLFYCASDGEIILTSRAEECLNFLERDPQRILEPLSLLEFLSFGYVTSNRSLLSGVKTIQSGETIKISNNSIEVLTTFLYGQSEVKEKLVGELTDELDEVVKRIFSSLAEDLKGRTALVPLSGGYDSRFIVCMLKTLGIDDVICLSYSTPGSYESEMSKAVAQALGYRWYFVELNKAVWTEEFEKEDFHQFLDFAHNFTSVTHIQEYPLLTLLPTKVKIDDPKEFVFIPGHTVVSGFLTPGIMHAKSIDTVLSEVVKRHFTYRYPPIPDTIHEELHRQFSEDYSSIRDPRRLSELFNWRERQSKFIANANRIYDYFGYHWALPLWSKEYMDFWGSVPLDLKFGKKLYGEYLENRLFKQLGVDFDLEDRLQRRSQDFRALDAKRVRFSQFLKDMIKRNRFLANLYRKARISVLGSRNPCAFDIANQQMSIVSERMYQSEFEVLRSILRKEFPGGRAGDPNSYIAEHLLCVLLRKIGIKSS